MCIPLHKYKNNTWNRVKMIAPLLTNRFLELYRSYKKQLHKYDQSSGKWITDNIEFFYRMYPGSS